MTNYLSLFWCSGNTWERRLGLGGGWCGVFSFCFLLVKTFFCVCVCMCIRLFYGTYYCQRLRINCLAIACKLNMNLLIVRHIGDTCSPLSSWSSWSSSEDWDKYLIPNNENSHILSAWATFS